MDRQRNMGKQENLFTHVSDYGRMITHCSHPVKTSNRKTGFYLFQRLINSF